MHWGSKIRWMSIKFCHSCISYFTCCCNRSALEMIGNGWSHVMVCLYDTFFLFRAQTRCLLSSFSAKINLKLSRVMRKPAFCICENKDADQLRGNREADQRLCFATRIVQSLYFLSPKFQFTSRLVWLYSPVYVRPGRKPRRTVFSQRGSINAFVL